MVNRYVYHYCANLHHKSGVMISIDGILSTVKPITDMADYANAKQVIRASPEVPPEGSLVITNLSYLGREQPDEN